MEDIPLGISVNAWNAVKFIVLELFVSVVFASTWNLFLRRASARTLRNSAGVRLVPSGLGRFTPAEVGFHATDGDAEWRLQHRRTRAAIGVVNVLLFVLLFVLEYGSTDLSKFELRRVAVVTAQSIREHSRHTALRAGTIVEVSESVAQGFRPETRKALLTKKEVPDAPSQFELLEHIIDDGRKLDSPGVAVAFDDVCGDNEGTKIPKCSTIHEPFLSEKSMEGRKVVARVTRVHAFAELTTRIYDIALERSLGLVDNDKIDMRPLRLVGTCHGHRFTVEAIGVTSNMSTIESDACVLREAGSARVFSLFPSKLTSDELLFNRHRLNVTLFNRSRDVEPWVLPNATIVLKTNARGVLYFVPSVEVDTYTAVLSMVRHNSAYSILYGLKSLDFAPFREYRRHVLLLCLGLFGDYSEQKHVRIAKGSQQAAINVFFIVGLSGLVLLVFVLAIASACMGATRSFRIPVEMRTQLLSIRSATLGDGDADNVWPEFEHVNQLDVTIPTTSRVSAKLTQRHSFAQSI